MAETPKRVLPAALATSTSTILTAGAASTWQIIRSILVCNTDTVARTVTAGVGTSNTDSASKRIASALTVGAGETVDLMTSPGAAGFLVLQGHASTPDLLYALASATTVTITVSYIEGP